MDRICAGMDFRPFIEGVLPTNKLVFVDLAGKAIGANTNVTRFEAWAIVTANWYARLQVCPTIKGADARAESLADLMHSMGAARIASIWALVLAIVVASRVGVLSMETAAVFRGVVMIGLWVFLVLLHHAAYRRTALAVTLFVQTVLNEALVEEPAVPKEHTD